MKITFLGGTETVTGSKFLVETAQTRVLVDCGLFQGYKWLRERNRQLLPLDVQHLDAVILTHAHLDHSGYIPVLYKQGFTGPVFTHYATKALCQILLADSGHIQEEDAKYFGRHKIGKHEYPEPLYTKAEAQACMKLFQTLEFNESAAVGDIQFYLQPAGHILGAASIIMQAEGKQIGFSGDVGRPDDILMRPPKPLPKLDYLLLESTYGNRRHESEDPFEQLKNIVNATVKQGGHLLIPSFAVGRAQALQHILSELMDRGDIPEIPIYLDSPMAIDVSDIYYNYDNQHRLTHQQCQRMGQRITYTRTVDESKALADLVYPHIIIAGSGMANGGRILHHFKRLISNPKTRILFTGYQAGGTRGAKMLNGTDTVKIHGAWLPVKANIEVLEGFSGHADYIDIYQWLNQSAIGKKCQVYLVHGEPESLEAQRDYLRQHTSMQVQVAQYMQVLHI